MGTITIEILLLGTASIHRSLPQLAQVGVSIPIGVIASQRALIRRAPARSVACGGYRRVVARPDQAVLLVITEVLRFVASGATLPGDGSFGGRATEHITYRIVAHLVVEERRPVALPRRHSAGGTQISIVAHRAGSNGRARAIGTEITHSSDESLSVVGQGRQIGHSGTVVAHSGERSRGAIIRLAGRISAASSHAGLHHHRQVCVVIGLFLLILGERREGERSTRDGHVQPRGDQPPTLVVLPVLRHRALRVVGTGQIRDRHALGQCSHRVIASRPGDATRIGIVGVLDEGIGSAGAGSMHIGGGRGILHTAHSS